MYVVDLAGRIREVFREAFLDGQNGDDLRSAYRRDPLDDNVVVANSDQFADGLHSTLVVKGEDLDDAVGGTPEDA